MRLRQGVSQLHSVRELLDQTAQLQVSVRALRLGEEGKDSDSSKEEEEEDS